MLFISVGAGGGGIVGNLTTVMFKDLGMSNAIVGAAALLSLPSSFRFFWAPWVDGLGSKRGLCWRFILILGVLILVLAGLVAGGLTNPILLFLVLFVFAYFFSCLEVASDGYYIRIFKPRDQAEFVGIKVAGIRAGIIISIVVFVRLAGEWQEKGWDKQVAWGCTIALAALMFFVFALYTRYALPRADDDEAVKDATGFPLKTILKEYLQQKRVWAIVVMLLIFRFGQGILVYMSPAFYMDTMEAGGFGLNTKEVALLKTFTDVPWMIIGGIAGGLIVQRYGLKRLIYPFTLLLALPNFGYVYLAAIQPTTIVALLGERFYLELFLVSTLESLGYGVGFSGFYYYIHAIATGRHKTSMLAISSGLMGLGFYLPGGMSGVLQEYLGYSALFGVSCFIGLLTLVVLPLLPMPSFEDTPRPRKMSQKQ